MLKNVIAFQSDLAKSLAEEHTTSYERIGLPGTSEGNLCLRYLTIANFDSRLQFWLANGKILKDIMGRFWSESYDHWSRLEKVCSSGRREGECQVTDVLRENVQPSKHVYPTPNSARFARDPRCEPVKNYHQMQFPRSFSKWRINNFARRTLNDVSKKRIGFASYCIFWRMVQQVRTFFDLHNFANPAQLQAAHRAHLAREQKMF